MVWLLVPLAYLVGSVQPGLIVVRLMRDVDVRTVGSGGTGVTNVLRAAGKRAAAAVFVADGGKGLAIAIAARLLSPDNANLHALAAAAVIAGHVWPILTRFRGGRGMATGFGAALGFDPWPGVVGLAGFVPVVALTRYVSLGSVVAVLLGVGAFAVRAAFFDAPLAYVWFAIAGGALIIAKHRENIRRLLRGQERRLGQPAA